MSKRECSLLLLLLLLLILIMPAVHGHGRGKRLGTCPMVKPCVSGVVSLQHMCMHHLTSPEAARYTRYILVVQKGKEIALVRKSKATPLCINQHALSHYIVLHCNHRFKLNFKQIYNSESHQG